MNEELFDLIKSKYNELKDNQKEYLVELIENQLSGIINFLEYILYMNESFKENIEKRDAIIKDRFVKLIKKNHIPYIDNNRNDIMSKEEFIKFINEEFEIAISSDIRKFRRTMNKMSYDDLLNIITELKTKYILN